MSDITLPKSPSTVSVKAFNIASPKTSIPAALFIHPVTPGRERLSSPDYAFLVEHTSSGRKVLFDLGPMKDFSKLPPAMQGLLGQAGFEMSVDVDITEQLKAGGVSVDEIDTVIWSHSHFDHTGDMSLFPSKTKLVVGKGTDRRTFPSVPDAMLLESDFAGHEVTELTWEKPDLTIGDAPALDFFGDGSFYLFDMPGHWPGHLSALARVKENSFVLLGADVCHHPGQLRPNPHLHKHFPCPGGILSDLSKPILSIPEGFSMYAHRPSALESQEKLAVLDAHPDIFVITAHDPTLDEIITLFPKTVNDWKELGWKAKASWAFLEEGNKGYGYHSK
ncbi:beta-lactamase-like protein [Lentinula raphanica]|uniref:Beta-lactamase-like protein n=1 Tax=Lentinula raphanica TaxID=153919 RepID=A0AA38PDK5_9AGAR|nr:beta-lactamase-like protein [Lentinula raphanica]